MIIKIKNHIIYIVIIIFLVGFLSFLQLNKIAKKHNLTRKVLYDDKQSSYSEYLVGYYLLKNQDTENALSYLLNSYIESNNDKILQDYFISLILSGKIEKSIEIIEQHKKNIALFDILLALDRIKKNEYDKALSILKNINEDEIDKTLVSLVKIWCQVSLKNYNVLKSEFNNLNVSSEKYNLAKFQQALILNHAGYEDEAEQEFDELFLDPQPMHYAEIGQNFYRKIGKKSKADLLEKKYNIQYNAQKEDLNLSVSQALSIFLSDISLILFNNNFSPQSFIYGQFAYYLNNDSDQNNFVLGNQYFRIKKYDKAIEYFSKFKNISERYIIANVNIANCLYKLGKLEESQNLLRNIIETYKNSFESVIIAGIALGESYQNEQNYDEAIKIYDYIINNITKGEKDYWVIYYMRAVSNQLNKNLPQAEQDYLKALKLSPENPQILNDLAYHWIDEDKNLPEAFKLINKAISIFPEDPQIIDTMGWAMFKLGRLEEALDYLDKAIKLVPFDSTISNHLGDVYWKLGKKNTARFEWQHAYDNAAEEAVKIHIASKIQNGI